MGRVDCDVACRANSQHIAVSIFSARQAPEFAAEASFREGLRKVNLEIEDGHGKARTVQDTKLGASLGGILFSSHLLHALP